MDILNIHIKVIKELLDLVKLSKKRIWVYLYKNNDLTKFI